MKNYLLLFLSVASDVAKNGYWNHFSKNKMNTLRDTCLFNVVVGIGSILFFAVFGRQFLISPYTIFLAAIFAVVTAGAQFFSVVALSCGPMSVSVLFTYLGGILIPTIFGIVRSQNGVTVLQLVGLALMLVTVFFGTSNDKGAVDKPAKKWLFFAVGSCVLWGLVGICQQLQQESRYGESEQNGFLFWAFVMMTGLFLVLSLIREKGKENGYRVMQPGSLIIVGTGLLNGAVNLINLFLSGHMPSIIFFPIVNGGVIILATLIALVIFRERLNWRQTVSIVAGLISVVLLGVC